MNKPHDESTITHQPEASRHVPEAQPVPIEVRWNIPAWMMRDPGPQVEIEDDQFEEKEA